VAHKAVGTEGHGTSLHTTGWALLRSRDFGLLWMGQAVSQIGDGLNKVALLWFVYELTGSALKMTFIGLLQTIPPLVLGPLIGVYLDRLPKKAVMIWIDLARTLLVLLIPLLYAVHALTLERLYTLVFLVAIVSTVFGPALASSVPLIVSRAQLTSANALIQSTTNIGVLIGPAVSGLGIALIGAQNVLYVNAATFFVSALFLLPIRVRRLTLPGWRAAPSHVLHEMREGFRFVFLEQPIMRGLMMAATLYSLAASAFIFMLPVFAKQVLHLGPIQLGWLWSALGVGMLVASAWLALLHQGELPSRFRMIGAAMAVGALAVASLAVLDHPLVAALLMVAIGGTTALFTPIAWALLQEITPARLLARVLTTFSTGGMFAAMIGMAAFGWAADTLGATASLFGIAATLMMTALLALRFSRRCAIMHPAVADPLPAA
jgi:MFS transporter, DHA3 family, macrolide efflux protein